MSAPIGWLTLKWMLPSPRWPNATTRAPGMNAATAAVASAMKAGTAPTGVETSCLIEPPCGFCASDIVFAQPPERLALLERRGERRVGDQVALERVAEQRGQRVVEAGFVLRR